MSPRKCHHSDFFFFVQPPLPMSCLAKSATAWHSLHVSPAPYFFLKSTIQLQNLICIISVYITNKNMEIRVYVLSRFSFRQHVCHAGVIWPCLVFSSAVTLRMHKIYQRSHCMTVCIQK